MGNISTLGTALLSQVKADALVPVNTALDNIIATPSAQNVAGQGAQLLASLIPLLPLLEGQAIKDIATSLKASLANPTIAAGASTATTAAIAAASAK